MMAKVSIGNCTTYEIEKVIKVLNEGIDNIGGIGAYINPGDKVLLKVNLLMKKLPEEATTTHPVFVKALAEILSEQGAVVIIGDSPGGLFNERALRSVYRGSGYEDLHDEDKNIFLNYNVNEVTVTHDHLYLLKTLNVIEILNQVDKVISVSKLKTHGMTVFTGAVKNMFGTVPGIYKAEYHFKMPKIEDFTNMLVDVCLNSNPVLSFMDGIVGMEGAGPSAGDPIEIGAVIVSDSPYHLDCVASKLVGISPKEVPTIQRCIERNMVKEDSSDIEMAGLQYQDFKPLNIKRPQIGGISLLKSKLPTYISKPITRIMNPKPVFDLNICVKCGDCVRACPSNAIQMKEAGPLVDLDLCIRCFCCQELCPHKAVEIKRNLLLSYLVKL